MLMVQISLREASIPNVLIAGYLDMEQTMSKLFLLYKKKGLAIMSFFFSLVIL